MKKTIKEYGYLILRKRDYSIFEFEEKLKKKYLDISIEKAKREEINKAIKKIIGEFVKNGYLDDMQYVISYINTHNYGYKKYEFIFRSKGIKESVYREILESNKSKEINDIKKIWEKLGDKPNDKKIASLLNKGFLYKDVKIFLDEM